MASCRSTRRARATVSSIVSWRSAASRVTRACVSRLTRIVVVSTMPTVYALVDLWVYTFNDAGFDLP